MNKADRRHWRWLALALAAITAGIVVFRSLIVTVVLEPMAWLFWAGWRVLASVNRGICWTFVVVVCAALVVRLVLSRFDFHAEEHLPPETGRVARDRLAHWEIVAARAEQTAEGRLAFRASLEPLALSVAEMTGTRSPRLASEQPSVGPVAWLLRLFPNRRRRAELRAIEDLLAGMESALEIRNERESE